MRLCLSRLVPVIRRLALTKEAQHQRADAGGKVFWRRVHMFAAVAGAEALGFLRQPNEHVACVTARDETNSTGGPL